MDNVFTFKGRQQPPPPPSRAPRVIMLGVSMGGVRFPHTIASYHLRETMVPSGIDHVIYPDLIAVNGKCLCAVDGSGLPPHGLTPANDQGA